MDLESGESHNILILIVVDLEREMALESHGSQDRLILEVVGLKIGKF